MSVESTVNRWIIDYYLTLALDFFKNNQYTDFCNTRDVLGSVMVRPTSTTEVMSVKIFVINLLSRIIDGENLDLSFDPADDSRTPLESALVLLEGQSENCNIPQEELEKVCTSLKEMIVCLFIRSKEFDRAKEVLIKHFPEPLDGKNAVFMSLIRQRNASHKLIRNLDFQQFKKEVLTFCLSFCPCTIPFLHKAAEKLLDRLKEQEDEAAGAGEQDDHGLSSSQIRNGKIVWKNSIIQRTRLEAAYNALAAGSNNITFLELEKEVRKENRIESVSLFRSPSPRMVSPQVQNETFQGQSASPMEALTEQQLQTDAAPPTHAASAPCVKPKLCTVAKLVIEPDSPLLQCTPCQEQEADTDEPASLCSSRKGDLQSPETNIEITFIETSPSSAANTFSRAPRHLEQVPANREKEPMSSETNSPHHDQITPSTGTAPPNCPLGRLTAPHFRSFTESQESPNHMEVDQKHVATCKPLVQKPQTKTTARNSLNMATGNADFDTGDAEEICIQDSSLDTSPSLCCHDSPQRSSTPHRGRSPGSRPSHSKWRKLFHNAKESKETWTDDEPSRKSSVSHHSNSGPKRRMWTKTETAWLKEGVKKFGEGNWSQIKEHYSFSDRTNVNLKDRWRTMKKMNMV